MSPTTDPRSETPRRLRLGRQGVATTMIALALTGCSTPHSSGSETLTTLAVSDHDVADMAPSGPPATILATESGNPNISTAPDRRRVTSVPLEQTETPELGLRPAEATEIAALLAVDLAVSDCMKSEGFEYAAPTEDEYLAGLAWRDDRSAAAFPRGDPRDAGLPPQAVPEPTDPNALYLSTLTADERQHWDTALSGTGPRAEFSIMGNVVSYPTDGCNTSAFNSVIGSPDEMRPAKFLIANLESFAHAAAFNESDVTAANLRWSECMTALGYKFAEFGEARFIEHPTEALAEADLNCARASSLTTTYRNAFNTAITDAYKDHRDVIDAYLTRIRDVAGPSD